MFGGPLLLRELLTLPRQPKHFGLRAGYVLALCVLIYTGAQTTFGLTPLRSISDIAMFGAWIFSVVCIVQLALVIACSLLFSAGAVAQDKDRRTLILLLMTDLRTPELVLGRSLGSIVPVLVLILVSIPVLCLLRILGGVTLDQIVWVELICLVSALAASAWGTLVGYWREKTFQILSISLLGAGLFLGLTEAVMFTAGADSQIGRIAAWLNPFRSLGNVLNPFEGATSETVPVLQAWGTSGALLAVAAILWVWTCLRVRVWNPSRTIYIQAEEKPEPADEAAASQKSRSKTRDVWSTPVLWREICTQAYGRKVGLIKLAYFVLAAGGILWLGQLPADAPPAFGVLNGSGVVFAILSLLALFLVNAQSVTSLTSERDGQTLELLLVTEVTAKEFVFGKLGGVLFNTKEVIAVPLLLAAMTFIRGGMTLSGFLSLLVGFLVLVLFSAMLGLHSGFSHASSRSAILNSLGTIFFLFIGIFICMMLIVEARASFMLQLVPFLVFILGGSLGLWMSLTHQNPSPALTLCAWTLPFLTFYAIVSFLLTDNVAVSLAILAGYGFTTLSMLIPAVSAFDVALGRTTLDRG